MNSLLLMLNTVAEPFWSFTWMMLAQSCILIVALLAADMLLRRHIRAVVRYALWMLVLVKLVLPPGLTSPTSVGRWVGEWWPASSPSPIMQATPAPMSPDVTIGDEIRLANPPTTPMRPAPATELSPSSQTRSLQPVPRPALSWQSIIFLGWLAGVLALGLIFVQRALLCARLLRKAKETNGELDGLLDECCSAIKLGRDHVRIKLVDKPISPAVCGMFRPVILLPRYLLEQLNREQLRSVLLHELAHIKRCDLPVNLAQTILQLVYFYNPLLWLANAIIRRVREQAVDEMVLVALGKDAPNYSRTLVDIAELAFRSPMLGLRLIGVVESKKALAQRIRHIVTRPLPKTAKVGISGLILVLLVGCALLPMAKDHKEAAAKINKPADRAIVLAGRVQNEAGTPLAGARVLVVYSAAHHSNENRALAEGRTDAQGNFRIEYIMPPTKQWLVDDPSYPQLTLLAAHPDYAPNGYRLSRDQAEEKIAITLEPGRGPYRVYIGEGIAKGHPPVAGATVWIPTAFKVDDGDLKEYPSLRRKSSPVYDGKHGFDFIGNQHICEATTGTNGWAEFAHVPSAGVFINVSSPGFSDNYQGSSRVDEPSVKLYLWPEGKIAGKVTCTDGPVTGGVVWAEAKWNFHFGQSAEVQPDGSFLLTGLHVQGWAPEWSKPNGASGEYAIRYEPGATGLRLVGDPTNTTLTPTNRTAKVTLTTVTGGILVTGRVYNAETGQGIESQSIGFNRRSPAAQMRKQTITDRDGRFSTLLPPGDFCYWLELRLTGEALDPDSNAKYIGHSGRINDLIVSPGMRPLDIPLHTIPLGAMTVKILDMQGTPATNVAILLTDERSQGVRIPWHEQQTDSNGVYRMTNAPVKGGLYVLARTIDRKQVVCSRVNLADAMRPEGVTLKMGPALEFDVKVVDNGKPVPNEYVTVHFMTGEIGHYENGAEARTDTNGVARMTGLPPGYDFRGMLGKRNNYQTENQQFQLPAGFKSGQFTIEKDRKDNVLWCKFTAQDGNPAFGVNVRLQNSWELGGIPQQTQTNKALEQEWTTGTNGEIRANGYMLGTAELLCLLPSTTSWHHVKWEEDRLRWEGDQAANTYPVSLLSG